MFNVSYDLEQYRSTICTEPINRGEWLDPLDLEHLNGLGDGLSTDGAQGTWLGTWQANCKVTTRNQHTILVSLVTNFTQSIFPHCFLVVNFGAVVEAFDERRGYGAGIIVFSGISSIHPVTRATGNAATAETEPYHNAGKFYYRYAVSEALIGIGRIIERASLIHCMARLIVKTPLARPTTSTILAIAVVAFIC